MFGIGPTELLIIGLLALLVFGPEKLANMARDFGRFISGANRTVEEIKSELLPEELEEQRRALDEIKSELTVSSAGEEEGGEPGRRHPSR